MNVQWTVQMRDPGVLQLLISLRTENGNTVNVGGVLFLFFF